jgi:hypothetical protein
VFFSKRHQIEEARQAQASKLNWAGRIRLISNATGMTACLAALLLFTACDSETAITGVDPVTEQEAVVQSTYFAVTPSSANLASGDTVRLRAQRISDGTAVSVSWSSSNSDIAWVGSSGKVYAKANGSATITASSSTYGSSTATITVGATSSDASTTTSTPTTTTTTTSTSPVLTTVAVTPATASVNVGATMQLTGVAKDQNGDAMSDVSFTWSSANPSIATVTSSGVVTGVAAGQVAIAASSGGKTASSMVTVTAVSTSTTSTAAAGAAPVARGIWISKAELDARPMSGADWTDMLATANATWAVQGVEVYSGQKYAQSVMAGALVFARTYPASSAEAYRTKVVQAIRNEIALPDDLSSMISGVNRFIGSWAIIADLINLPAYDPALDAQLRAWLNHKLDMKLESSGKTVRTQVTHANNHGSWATFSLSAVAAYTGDRATLDMLAVRYRRWLGNTSAPYTLKWTGVQSFQLNPSSSATWVGIAPKGATRDGNNFDGIQPSDINRGTPETYSPADFPNSALSHRYPETSLHGAMGAVLILDRAGYTDLVDASNQAILRGAKWIKYAADNFSADGYVYFTGPHEAARPLINFFYPGTGLPGTRSRSQLSGASYGYAWTYWTHSGRSLR